MMSPPLISAPVLVWATLNSRLIAPRVPPHSVYEHNQGTGGLVRAAPLRPTDKPETPHGTKGSRGSIRATVATNP